MAKTLTPEQLEALRRFDAPTVANAIETFNVQPRNTGFMLPDIRCMFPDMGVMVGYACTAVIAADHQPSAGSLPERPDWWRTVLATPAPRVVVLQDSDAQPDEPNSQAHDPALPASTDQRAGVHAQCEHGGHEEPGDREQDSPADASLRHIGIVS